MNERTRATLERLEEAEWFQAVGQTDTNAAKVVSSWKEAINSCASDDWQDLILEAANRYTEQLATRSEARFQQWNVIVREMKQHTIPLVSRKIAHVKSVNKLPKIFDDTVNWDILHVMMEAEFADVYPPGFFASQAYWYIQGHFPCGWEGTFPNGVLVVY